MTSEQFGKLRNGQTLHLFDTDRKEFVALQINKSESSFICWKRLVSKDRKNWVTQNLYLSLRDCRTVVDDIKARRKVN
jgi:hypothetical protein